MIVVRRQGLGSVFIATAASLVFLLNAPTAMARSHELSPATARAARMSLISLVHKGSRVGRFVVTENADALSQDIAAADVLADGDSVEKTTAPPVAGATQDNRSILNAIMKHPTEPHYDPLRPLSGRWERCQPNTNTDPEAHALLDRFSSSDRSHFTHTLVRTSDDACKAVLSERRTSYDCEATSKNELNCKAVKLESRKGSEGVWSTETATADKPVKLTFVGLPGRKSKKHHKNRKQVADDDASVVTGNAHQLEIRLNDGQSAETYKLAFNPIPPHSKRHAAEDESASSK